MVARVANGEYVAVSPTCSAMNTALLRRLALKDLTARGSLSSANQARFGPNGNECARHSDTGGPLNVTVRSCMTLVQISSSSMTVSMQQGKRLPHFEVARCVFGLRISSHKDSFWTPELLSASFPASPVSLPLYV